MTEEIILTINDAKGALYYLYKERERRQKILWTNKQGEKVNIKEIDDTYLNNLINLLERQSDLDDLNYEYAGCGFGGDEWWKD